MLHRALKSSSLLLPRVAPAVARPVSSMALPTSLERLFENNKKWRDGKKLLDPDYFDKTSQGQHPQYLWIGCSDSRVPAEEITGLAPGEVFVHRNVANLVVSNDISSLSVVQYAVEHLKVKDIIVCGHYGCGGVHAAVENKHLGLLDNWLRNIRDVVRLHNDELQQIDNHEQRMRRTVELNTIEQCINVFKIGLVQRHQVKYGFPRIHGLVYDLKNGELNEMDVDFQSYVRKYRSIYKLHSFPSEASLRRSQLQGNMIRTLVEGHDEEPGRVSAKYIKRAMAKEPILFSETEINSAITRAQEGEADVNSVNIEKLVRYFDH
ncbi:Carbonic anhydrase [Phytophthora cinnamomi]|uniref:Carbonic anhydrase n=1 Tax=Phytophthora cinnamomi TaxID=4785 RepID=UPI00355A44BF|nr:Carbonic anhydrase [Phytophthora cinnamomi]